MTPKTAEEVLNDIEMYIFKESVRLQRTSCKLDDFDCGKVSNFVRGEAFAYNLMLEWLEGYKLREEDDDE